MDRAGLAQDHRVIVSEHQTRLAARLSRWKWRRIQVKASGEDEPSIERLRLQGIGPWGKLTVEHGGRRTKEKWAVFYEHAPSPVPGPPPVPGAPRHRPVG